MKLVGKRSHLDAASKISVKNKEQEVRTFDLERQIPNKQPMKSLETIQKQQLLSKFLNAVNYFIAFINGFYQ